MSNKEQSVKVSDTTKA